MPYPTPQPLSTRTTAPNGRRYWQLNPRALASFLSLPEVKTHSWRAQPFENPISNVPKIKPHTWRARQIARPKPAYEPIAAPGTVTPRRYAQGYVRRGPGYPEGGPTPATVYSSTPGQKNLSSPSRSSNPLRIYPPNQRGLANCIWRDAANQAVAAATVGAAAGALGGATVGAPALGVGSVPGAGVGALLSGAVAGSASMAGYGLTCWW